MCRMGCSRGTLRPRSGSDDRHPCSTVAPCPAMGNECWSHPLFSSFRPIREVSALGLDAWALSRSLRMARRISGNRCSRNRLWWRYSSLRQSSAWNWHSRPHVNFSDSFQYLLQLFETVPTYIDTTLFRPRMSREIHAKAIMYTAETNTDCA